VKIPLNSCCRDIRLIKQFGKIGPDGKIHKIKVRNSGTRSDDKGFHR
jgi:hypothetical protein